MAAIPPDKLFRDAGLDVYGVCDLTPDLLGVPCRARRRVPEGAPSLIVAAIPYYVGAFAHRNISRYAMPDDYHTVAGSLLSALASALSEAFPGESFLPFADASPICEVEAGVRAGLGVRGLNGQLITPRYGSYVFIGELISTLALRPSVPSGGTCLGCGRCVRACPTGALSPGGFAREKCRSHLTQKKQLCDPAERRQVAQGGMVWGCDICTDICPMNFGAAYTPIGAFYRDIQAVFPEDGASFSRRAYAYKGRAALERNLALIQSESHRYHHD